MIDFFKRPRRRTRVFAGSSAVFTVLLVSAALINLIAAPQLFIWLRQLGH